MFSTEVHNAKYTEHSKSTGLNPDPDTQGHMPTPLTHESHQLLIDALLAQARDIAAEQQTARDEPESKPETKKEDV